MVMRPVAIIIFVLMVVGTRTTENMDLPSHPKCSTESTPNIHYDECGQRCRCVNGILVECTRMRKEFTAMSDYERHRYIQAIKSVSTDPKYKPTYDRFLYIHKYLFSHGIHTQEQFLPWHRWYVHQYENLLRSFDCRLTVPYWDWSVDSSEPWKTTPGSLWFLGPTGFGGNGSDSGCVTTGPFREGEWNLIPAVGGGCLTRHFNGYPHDPATVQYVLDLPVRAFREMESWIRIAFHNNIHNRVGGIMSTGDASSAPEFFLHHAILDKIWKDWQDQSPAHTYVYFPSVNMYLLGSKYLPVDYINSYALPGGDRVEYVDSEKRNYVYGNLNSRKGEYE